MKNKNSMKNLTTSESFSAILYALETAKVASNCPAPTKTILHVKGLQPHVVVNASHTFKVKLFGANSKKNFVHTEYEPFEDKDVKIIFISRPINSMAMRAINYAEVG